MNNNKKKHNTSFKQMIQKCFKSNLSISNGFFLFKVALDIHKI